MSGGEFGYLQNRLEWDFIDRVRAVIEKNNTEIPKDLKRIYDFDIDVNIEKKKEFYSQYSDETIKEFENAIEIVSKAKIYIQRIDWLMSGDDSEEAFHRRLKSDLSNE